MTGKPEYVSDLLVETMCMLGIEYAALNPGATFRALHDSLVQYGGGKNPEVVLCCHEEIAVAIADGYARAKGRPMAVIVHDIVGLQHATKAIFESWLERIPMLIIGGTGPLSVGERRPWIDWIHTARMNADLVREYVKWDDEPQDVVGAVEALLRGYRISVTPPQGPVYVCYDILLQERKLDGQDGQFVPDVQRFKPPAPPQMDNESLDRVAKHLVEAKHPVIIAENVGRKPEAFSHLVQLAELLAIPVIDMDSSCLNFPNTNELDVTGGREEALKDADIVLGIDLPDLQHALTVSESSQHRKTRRLVDESAKIIQIGLEDYSIKSWNHDYGRLYPVDIPVTAESTVAIPALIQKSKTLLSPASKRLLEERREYAARIHKALREKWAEQAKRVWNQKPISTARLASELWEAVKEEDWVLGHGSLNGWVRRLWRLEDPSRYFDPSISTGSGLGISIGVALANRASDKLFLSIVGDGDMLYTPSTLWTAANLQTPLLVVMFNNRSYYQDEGHQLLMAKIRGRDESKVGVGIKIDNPSPDFAMLAKSFGLNGIGPVDDPNDLTAALPRAVALLKKERKLTLLDVITQPR